MKRPFLGAPPHRNGRRQDTWFLTKRDRFANNIGLHLMPANPDPEFDPPEITGSAPTTPLCPEGTPELAARTRSATQGNAMARLLTSGYLESIGFRDVPRPIPVK